jgi:peptide/nickel transport system substrate-binding protein
MSANDKRADAAGGRGSSGNPQGAWRWVFDSLTVPSTRRSFLKATGVTAASSASLAGLMAFIEACTPGGGSTTTGSATKGGHLIEGINSDPDSLNPMLAVNNVGQITNSLLFEPLLVVGPDGNFEPALAELPQQSSDQRSYTFKLRPNLKWSDGAPITSDDVVFTFNLITAPEYKAFNTLTRSLAEQYVASVSAPDPATVVITSKEVYAPFLFQFGTNTKILPKHVLGNISATDLNTTNWNNAPDPVNGVFKLVKWTRGAQIEYARNPNYFRGPSNLDGYVIKVLQDAVALATAARTGDVDIAGQVEYSQIASLKNSPNLTLKGIQSDEGTMLGFQLRSDHSASTFFADKTVRQALYYALDRPKMMNAAEFGSAVVTNSVEPPTSYTYDPNVTPAYTYDPAKANTMLDAAGWVKGSGGIRQKNGVPFKFEIITDNQHGDHVTTAQTAQNAWQALGLQVDVRLVTFSELIQALIFRRDFDAFIIGFQLNNSGPDPDEFNSWYSSSIGNITGFTLADDLINKGLQTTDKNQRTQIYQQFQKLMADQVPAMALWVLKYAWAINKRVGNFNVNSYQMLTFRTWMKDIYVRG